MHSWNKLCNINWKYPIFHHTYLSLLNLGLMFIVYRFLNPSALIENASMIFFSGRGHHSCSVYQCWSALIWVCRRDWWKCLKSIRKCSVENCNWKSCLVQLDFSANLFFLVVKSWLIHFLFVSDTSKCQTLPLSTQSVDGEILNSVLPSL